MEFVTRWLPEIYLGVALAIATTLCWTTAPFFTPDEPAHSMHAIALGHGIATGYMGTDAFGVRQVGGDIDANALRVMLAVDEARMQWERGTRDYLDRPHGAVSHSEAQQRELAGERWAGSFDGKPARAFAAFPNTAVYPPLLYGPAIAGWRIGEAADWTIFASLRLARLLGAWTAVMLGWWAMRRAGRAGALLVGFLLLPSVVFLDAGCSQDAVLMGVAAMVMAMLARALDEAREFTRAELAGLTGLLMLCGGARPPYMAMALVLFVPGLAVQSRRWVGPGCGFAAVVAACAAWRHVVAPLGFDTNDQADPEAQIAWVQGHPVATAAALLHGTGHAAWDFVHRGLYVVGWNDLLPHHGAAAVLAAALAVLVMTGPRVPVRGWMARAVLAVAVCLPLLGISLAEYVIWTAPGAGTVYGVQPRYWLPVMPLALLLVRGLLPVRERRWGRMAACAVMVAMACTLPWMAADAFYREGLLQVLRLNMP